ncbi:ABC transporter substrate-binding protein [Streptomyces pseudovenezuelae]|uniref:Leucine-binding protein domain-containing protein n=1 Tax=Streptomyces pseudovenezuelae TaxID=67350 RepID=A0ABT6LX51_9ACTN|nr:ABC transporter substrate-binding protein [Streptomyces pseudovenezuelae]MDH6220884.1 hypothetical protein [Streptomyces pseudovenezuelae]
MPGFGRSGRPTALLSATAAVLLVATACGSGTGSSSGSIKIGASLPLSGPVADASKPAYEGYKVWLDQLNEKGGLLGRKVELKVLDDGFEQNTVVTNYNRLISQERSDLLLGTFSSKLNLPASAVAERNKMLYVEPSGGAEEIFTRGYDYLFFAQPSTSLDLPDQFVQYIKSLPADQRPKTAAYPTQDDPNTDVTIEEFRKALTKLGVKTVYSEKYAPETVNFDPIASAIARGRDRRPGRRGHARPRRQRLHRRTGRTGAVRRPARPRRRGEAGQRLPQARQAHGARRHRRSGAPGHPRPPGRVPAAHHRNRQRPALRGRARARPAGTLRVPPVAAAPRASPDPPDSQDGR